MYHTGNLWLVITTWLLCLTILNHQICLGVVINQNLILTYLLGAVTLVILAHPLQCVPMRGVSFRKLLKGGQIAASRHQGGGGGILHYTHILGGHIIVRQRDRGI